MTFQANAAASAGAAVIQDIPRGPNFSYAGIGGKQKSVFTLQKWEPKIW